jgi:quaternary ammonium compound-resistance protein SugE
MVGQKKPLTPHRFKLMRFAGDRDFYEPTPTKSMIMTTTAWVTLLVAGIMETGWAVGLKYSAGFSRLLPSAVTIGLMAGSFYFLSRSLQDLPLGTAYAVWTGIGAIGTVLVGIALFGESRDAARMVCLFLIIAGILGLRLVTVD